MLFYKKFAKIKTNVTNWIYLRKLSRASNASLNISKVRSHFSLQMKFNKLLLSKKWQAGRGGTGRIVAYSKTSRIKKRLPFINYSYRRSCLFFIAGLNYTGFKNKISSLVINSQGEISYLPTSINNDFFMLNSFKPLLFKQRYVSMYKEIKVLKPFIHITQLPYMLIQQKKNSPVNHIEQYPLLGSQYTRSFGSHASIIKLDTRTGLSIVKLSSGLKKVFSAFSLANEGHSNIKILKNRIFDTKSGNWRKQGSKPRVRGVAKNPVDHPHGGRTNSIKYPRTPWGKTTKFK